ncbi:MAG TPA: hypothetical protein PKK48_10040 [Phycisphaerae bacterium]|nr:hypothetical protein [Phycisphaerae bacterium]HPS52468.1 hypothetical protein [Phycisphaerae bacterium]
MADEEDIVIPLAPLDEAAETRRKEEIRRCLEIQESLIAEQTGQGVIPMEHRENLSARDMDHLIVNYCIDSYNCNIGRLRVHIEKMRPYKDIAILSANDFLYGRVAEKSLNVMLPEELADYLNDLIGRLKAL